MPSRGFLPSIVLAAALITAVPAADAQSCFPNQCGWSSCHTPARGVPAGLWGDIQPTDVGTLPTSRDSTDFDQVGPYEPNPYWMSLDIENGWIFTAANLRFQIWDARSNPGNPSRSADVGFSRMGLVWNNDPHSFYIIRDVDAPPGNDRVAATAMRDGAGVVVFNTNNKTSPSAVYQDHGPNQQKFAYQVYATTLNGQDYAFAAAESLDGGVYTYNLTQASQLTTRCTEGQPSQGGSPCPGVYVGKVGSRGSAHYVDGAGNYIVFSSGSTPTGFEIWDVSNPAVPQRRMNALTSEAVYGVAMWREGSSYFLGLRTNFEGRIYDVSCITSGGSSCNPTLRWSQGSMPFAAETFVTFSRNGSTPFLYFGAQTDCVSGDQKEWLFDVTSPSAPQDISPQGTVNDNGEPVSYWGWYYRRNGVHGFNFVGPRVGKFSGDYFYRAATAIFDIHRRTGGSPPNPNFTWNPAQIYPDTPISFTDQSTGNPNSWDWDFQPDGVPGSSTAQNPTGVRFPTPGNKTVQLTASNNAGSNSTQRTVPVLDPVPVVGGVSASPNPALICQPITFQATTVTGRPPLTFAWTVRDAGSTTVATGGNVNPFIWNTGPGTPAGTYTAEVTVSNSDGADSATSLPVTLNAPPALPPANTFAPTYDGQPNPPPSSTVQFHVNAAGATEWNWNFGDNPGGGPDGDGYEGWTSDPVNGPNPLHSYTSTGTYDVMVKVRNCVEAQRESNAVSVQITNVTPLQALFQAQSGGGVVCTGAGCVVDVGTPITFQDMSTGDPDFWDYDWDGNSTYEDDNNTSPVTTHTYTSAGTYHPILRVRRGADQDVYTGHVNIIVTDGNPPPPVSINISGPGAGETGQALTFNATASNCTPNPTGWTWNTAGGSGSSTSSNITVTWNSAGTKNLTATNSGCSGATGTKTVVITEPGGGGGGGDVNASFTYSPPNPAVNQEVSFDGRASSGNPSRYNWDFGDGETGNGSTTTHTFAAAGNYSVRLTVERDDSSCPFGVCSDTQTRTVVVSGGGGGGDDLVARITVAGCNLQVCEVEVGQRVTLTDSSQGNVVTRAWDFGDGNSSVESPVTYEWSATGTYLVTLLVSDGENADTDQRTFSVVEPGVAESRMVVLPWVAQTTGALDQASSLYVHNPADEALSVELIFHKRGQLDPEPPTVVLDLGAHETVYFPDVLADPFETGGLSGFITAKASGAGMAPEPVLTSLNQTFQGDGTKFGQGVSGVTLDAGLGGQPELAGPNTQHLLGLSDDLGRLSYFGLTNPNNYPTTYRLRFYDAAGNELAASGDLIVPRFGQKQYQIRQIRDDFGVEDVSDYRIEVETMEGGPLVPYGQILRRDSEDPAFVQIGSPGQGTVYLLGVLATAGINNSDWHTDVVGSNVGADPLSAQVIYTGVGPTTEPEEPRLVSFNPGETVRLADILVDQWGLEDTVGVLRFTTEPTEDGIYPIIQAESYDDANPDKRFGQFMAVFSEGDIAEPGERHFLAGLRQDEEARTTLWLFNPSDKRALLTLNYRKLSGELVEAVEFPIPPGKLRQINPETHPLPEEGYVDGFTLEILVDTGALLSAGQVVDNTTNDPAFVRGVKR